MNYIVSANRNLLVTDSLKEVYQFLRVLQERGIKYANIVGAKLAVRLTDNGFWVWTEEPPKESDNASVVRVHRGCSRP